MELKPCPFCGSNEVYIHIPGCKENTEQQWVCCDDCGAEGPPKAPGEGAGRAWNARVHMFIQASSSHDFDIIDVRPVQSVDKEDK